MTNHELVGKLDVAIRLLGSKKGDHEANSQAARDLIIVVRRELAGIDAESPPSINTRRSVGDPKRGPLPSKQGVARQWATTQLLGGPIMLRELIAKAAAQGISRTNLYHALNRIGVDMTFDDQGRKIVALGEEGIPNAEVLKEINEDANREDRRAGESTLPGPGRD